MKELAKKNNSSMQVLKTLKLMLQDDWTMQEIISKLNEKETDYVFNHSVISKYINTCRKCGIRIIKVHGKYFVTNLPFGLELTSGDITLLEQLDKVVKNKMSKEQGKIFNEFIEKLNRFSNKKMIKIDITHTKETIDLFKLAQKEKRKIRLFCKDKDNKIMDGIPLGIIDNKKRCYFHIIYNNKEKLISFNRIHAIKILNEKYTLNFYNQIVVFELRDVLAQRYCLRENERLVEPFDGHRIVVSNHGENKDILFSRLLRYDDKCKILNPKSYQKDMLDIINSALSNYGG